MHLVEVEKSTKHIVSVAVLAPNNDVPNGLGKWVSSAISNYRSCIKPLNFNMKPKTDQKQLETSKILAQMDAAFSVGTVTTTFPQRSVVKNTKSFQVRSLYLEPQSCNRPSLVSDSDYF